ncbi:glycoside hydrolase family 2 TIM barrel-domain containing protein [Reichenbachiella versicolor]|uniref:glycoside hydrolase family 2 TIM barrel-domain containing protein n=1 Tax=Reichenbachiella versicolor TaxID=1821036 RepID=UPI000D6DE01D|nr:glycoside hydrolase family 2 TIM barrel-domain containing protein [Reichenbachiella versicolor]
MRLLWHAVIVLLMGLTSCSTTYQPNTIENFDFDWKFAKTDIKGAEAMTFQDESWEDVELPHDWSISGPFSKENPSYSRGGWLPTGKCTYRKTFELSPEKKGQRILIYFDGAYRNSKVWINGNFLGERPYGYVAFYYDMTEHINYSGKNTITVKLDNSEQPGSRWYSGTGIYRHVKLISTNKLYIPIWGSYLVANDCNTENGTLKVETTVKNDFSEVKDFTIKYSLKDPSGNIVATQEGSGNLSTSESKVFSEVINVSSPKLWDTENPNLYTLTTTLISEGQVIYTKDNKTGFRNMQYNNENGFILNGKTTKLKGVCLHHAGGPLGSAIHRRTIQRQMEILKEMGVNAVRTAHNQFSEEFLEVCDEMGMLVMNEAFDEWEVVKKPTTFHEDGEKERIPVKFYAHLFKENSDRDLTDMVLRDRNHPSIFMWSIGNEIDQMRDEDGPVIAKHLQDIIHKYDYRPATCGVNGYAWGQFPNEEAMSIMDVAGYNYMKDENILQQRETYPERKMIITECGSAVPFRARGEFYLPSQKEGNTILPYSHKDTKTFLDRREEYEAGMYAWRIVRNKPYVMGQFIWTGFDYLGEVIPYSWPARSSSFGPIDLCGFPKDAFYYYQAQWKDGIDMVHLAPHWNWKGHEGEIVPVTVFTTGDEVELFLNGKSLGTKHHDITQADALYWDVKYTSGELKAVAKRDGNVIAEKSVVTTGAPAKIELFSRRSTMTADSQDLIYVEVSILDTDGNLVPLADNLVNFELEGEATIAGVGNGFNLSHEPFQADYRKAYNGKCLAILKSTKKAGEIKLTATSNGLKSAILGLSSK